MRWDSRLAHPTIYNVADKRFEPTPAAYLIGRDFMFKRDALMDQWKLPENWAIPGLTGCTATKVSCNPWPMNESP